MHLGISGPAEPGCDIFLREYFRKKGGGGGGDQLLGLHKKTHTYSIISKRPLQVLGPGPNVRRLMMQPKGQNVLYECISYLYQAALKLYHCTKINFFLPENVYSLNRNYFSI